MKESVVLIDLVDAVSETCGPKAAALGALRRAGLAVPDGFVVPPTIPDDWLCALVATGLERLGEGGVAVRSSAANEDTDHASAAGRYVSVLGVSGVQQVVDAVRTCRDSVHGARAVDDSPGRSEAAAMAVLVQPMVAADVAGVLFTPTTADQPHRIESSWGLGPSVVGGTVTPDAYRVDATGRISRTIGDKRTRWDHSGGRLVQSAVAVADRERPTLDDPDIRDLVALGQQVADLLGPGQDIEWAGADGRLRILQARPITAALPSSTPRSPASRSPVSRSPVSRSPVSPSPVSAATGGGLSGIPGSPGRATGPARIVRGPADFASVRAGDILVCPYTDPAWTPLLRMVSGVVTDTGGALAHAAIVARECRIPAVLGVPGATDRLPAGELVTLDGRLGTVTVHD